MQTGGVGSEPDNLTPCLCTMRVARNDEVPHYASRMHSASLRGWLSAHYAPAVRFQEVIGHRRGVVEVSSHERSWHSSIDNR